MQVWHPQLPSPCAGLCLDRVGWCWVPSDCRCGSPGMLLVPSLALSSLNKHAEAVAYYKKALELDPDNDTYKSNLKIAELKLREAPSPVSPPAGWGDGRPGWSPCSRRGGWQGYPGRRDDTGQSRPRCAMGVTELGSCLWSVSC